ncbi:MAG TPA: hypothetical protein VF759_13745 [Allosphingosinicella sp.]|jgi:hypothetical protein
MVKTTTISERIRIARRYVRAVDLGRDHEDPGALDGYVLTPSARDAAIRLVAGLASGSSQRAFRIVGPYGSGKSSFGVFLSQLVKNGEASPARAMLCEAAPEIETEIPSWRPAVISGRRTGFARELLRTVAQVSLAMGSQPATIGAAATAMLADERPLDAAVVADLVLRLATAVRAETGAGLLLLIDEMGRFLEYAAANIATEDPSIFQLIAERAGGRGDGDLGIVTFMHHRFSDYVSGMGGWIQDEWTRSSERYEELPFGESTEQSLFLTARALEPVGRAAPAVNRTAIALYCEAIERGVFATGRDEVTAIAPRLYPLHPGAVATLAAAIRRFGQNERSLFGFLQSLEPAGLQRFAHDTAYGADAWYRAPAVYDHVMATSSARPTGDRARRWSLAADALATAADMPESHRDVLKTIALLAVLEPVPGLSANADTLAWCVGSTEKAVEEILTQLIDRNVVYRRPHRGDYSLWSRSSVDLGDWLDQARQQTRAPERLQDVAHLLPAPRAMVAHRHYHRTGTLRTFDVQLFDRAAPRPRQADGLVLIAPVHPGENAAAVAADASQHVGGDPVALVCLRPVAGEHLKWAHELAMWRWIQDNCQELRVDELARAEVSDRVAAAEAALLEAIAPYTAAEGEGASWYLNDLSKAVPKAGISALLSDVCDEAFRKAPVLRNELINRSKLSTAVASARTRLLERMLTAEGEPYLGLEGAPPERTIYLSLFHDSGLHCSTEDGVHRFGAPPSDDPRNWMPVWQRIESTLSAGGPVTFAEIISDLGRPPYGLRQGPALLVATAFMLAARDRIALMERNSYQPDATPAHFMRLGKSPANFALRYLGGEGAPNAMLEALASGLTTLGSPTAPSVAAIAERLYRWWNALPQHALDTREIDEVAQAVRTTLRKATEPAKLLLEDLPVACGAVREGKVDEATYVERLDQALAAIDGATPLVRRRAAAATADAFGTRNVKELRVQLAADYGPHRLDLTDPRMRAFVDRASATDLDTDRWLDGIAGLLTGKRPDAWSDTSIDQYSYEIRVMAGRLARWLALARKRQAGSAELYSVHVVGIDGKEDVVVVRRDRPNPRLTSTLARVREALGGSQDAAEILGHLMAEHAGLSSARQKVD